MSFEDARLWRWKISRMEDVGRTPGFRSEQGRGFRGGGDGWGALRKAGQEDKRITGRSRMRHE